VCASAATRAIVSPSEKVTPDAPVRNVSRAIQPDFATLELEYVPDDLCVELKSWKLYLWSYRDEGAFHEAVTNRILDDLVAAIQPRYARLTADFNVRGGVYTSITAEHHAEGWAPVTNRLH